MELPKDSKNTNGSSRLGVAPKTDNNQNITKNANNFLCNVNDASIQ